MGTLFTASCLCKGVEFSINRPLHSTRFCHCENCRKFAGVSPAAWAMGEAKGLKVAKGEQLVGRFNSGRGIRSFCQNCGSAVWFESIDFPEIVGIPLGVIDTGAPPPPEMRLWVSSKPDWCTILDTLPQYEQGPD